ncbi:MAG TPA: hypothetical protein VFO31_25590 [Vicinamibacterales bacterium]|nr:hypothetical protein [Vicinamibacterales bacterium]
MHVLFSVRNPSYVRHYDSVLRLLAARGHTVELATEDRRNKPWPPSVLALAEEYPTVRLSRTPMPAGASWFELATRLRQARFYLRFLDPVYRGTPGLIARTREKAPPLSVTLGESPIGRSALGRRLLVAAIDALERATLTGRDYYDYLREMRPDVVVLTPLVVLKTAQIDLARAAIERGVRHAFAVASWDHLSSKGELNLTPQHVIVWNEVQQDEAVRLHGVPPDRITVTGAQLFDEWFDRQPSSSREAFCARVGLRADRPIVLYVCSALLEGSPPEADFVLRWVRALRQSGHESLRECGVLIRPHFKRGEEWAAVDLSGLDNVVCWPPAGAVPVDAESRTGYFDSLHHAAAVVGLNTSAMIEGAILGQPVLTVLLPEFSASQEGTVHFHYLLDGDGALLRASRSLDGHVEQLAQVLDGRDPDPDRSRRFVARFVRPHASNDAATVRVVHTLEAIAAAPAPAPVPPPAWTRLLRPLLRPFADAALRRVQRLTEERLRQKALLAAARRARKAEDRR